MKENEWQYETAAKVLDSFGASFWLKDALRSALKRDCLDAARDAEQLAIILRGRVDFGAEGSTSRTSGSCPHDSTEPIDGAR